MFKSINLLVIRGENPKELVDHYARLGFSYIVERHGDGPIHYSSSINGSVFEIYPGTSTGNVVGGFRVDSIKEFTKLCDKLEIKYKKIGDSVVVQDPDGNKILIGDL